MPQHKFISIISISLLFIIITISSKAQGSFTTEEPALDPNLQRPPKPSSIKVTPLFESECSTKIYRFEVEEDLPQSTPTRIFANGWQWQFTYGLAWNTVIDSGSWNSKKIVVKFLNNRALAFYDTVKVCYTSLIGNGQFQTTRQFDGRLRKTPTPTHILVKALEPSTEGYRRFRYSAPDSIPIVTDTTVQTNGWQWSFVGNLSQSMVIDSGNYNSKQIIVKLISNEVENEDDSVKLAYLSSCGLGNYTATKYTRTSGHKYIFDNYGLGIAEYDDGLSELWDNPNNWDEYPGMHLVYGDTVIYNGNGLLNIPVTFDFGSVFIVPEGYGSLNLQNNLTSNGKIFLNGGIYIHSEFGNLLGNYLMEIKGSFETFSYSFTQPGTIFINGGYGQLNMAWGSNTGTIVNNGYLGLNMVNDNFGTIINNGYFDYYYYGSNYGTIINNANILDWWGDYSNINLYYNYGTIVNNRKSSSVFGCEVNEFSGVIINNKELNSNITLNKGEIINNDHLSIFSSNNNGKIINNKYLTLSDYNSTNGHIITNDSLIFNGTTVIYSDSLVLNNDVIINGAFYNSSKLVNYGNISLNENAYIFNSELMNEQDGKISGAGVIYCESNGINKGIINCFGMSNWGMFINDNLGLIESIIDNTSIFENKGVINISNSQVLLNQFDFKNNGTINLSTGAYFENINSYFKNYGTINSSALFYEYNSTFENYGTLNNFSEYYPSHTVNYGVINNDSIINLFNDYQERTIDNYSIINNNGAIIGSGNINNFNGIIINNGIVSPGSTRNASIDSLNNNTTSRSVVNTISPSSTNETFKIGSLTFSDFIGTPTFEIEIADTSRTTGHDFVTVNDTLNAGGTINLAISYLPNPNDEITIMHADTVVNQFDTVNIPSGWSLLYNHPNKGDISVKFDKTNLNVKAFLEGYYNGNSTMNTLLHNIGLTEDATAVDSIEVQMWSPDNLNLSEPTFTSKIILHNDGNANLSLPINMIGNNYYICIKHKNSIETWSAEPISISTVNNYDFTSSQDKAYSNNLNNPLKSMPDGNFAIYSGDNNQDGSIDIFDMMITENDAANLFFGYGFTDCNGDGAADILDMQIIENNSGLMIYYASPR